MKFTIIHDQNLNDDEIVIKHNKDLETVKALSDFLLNRNKTLAPLKLYKDDLQFYLNLSDLVFFETSENIVYAHTQTQAFETKYKLYELEELLPDFFVRISKSTICNVNYIHSINRNLTSLRLVKFKATSKEVYVSRMYYPNLKAQLEKRLHNG